MVEKKAWVIVQGHGEYSDRCETVVKVFLNVERAQDEILRLERIRIKYRGRRGDDQSEENRNNAEKAYELLGYEDADGAEDWKLVEALLTD